MKPMTVSTKQDRLQHVEGRGDADDQEDAPREPDRRAGHAQHPAHRVLRAAQQILEVRRLEALQVDRDDAIEQDRVRVSLDDRAEHLLLLVLHEVRDARGDGQSDHQPEKLRDAIEAAAALRREHGRDEIARHDELRSGDHRAHSLRRERCEESAGRGLPHEVERGCEHPWDASELAALLRRLHVPSATGEHHDASVSRSGWRSATSR